MKKLLALVALLALTGFGCAAKTDGPAPLANTQTYTNTQYGFSVMYPENDEIRVREEDVRADKYLGRDVDFFASLRDLKRPKENAPFTLAYVYAAKGMSVAAFKQALEESGKDIAVKSTKEVKMNGVKMTKVTSTTDSGVDKIHYLLDRNGTLVIFSISISQDAVVEAIMQSISVK